MTGFAIFLVALGVFHSSVTGENSLQSDNEESKHSPVLSLTLKLIADMHEFSKEVVELKSEITGNTIENKELVSDLKNEIIELKSEISETKISNMGLISENNDLKREVSGVKAVLEEQEDTIKDLESKLINYETQRQDGKESGATYVRWGRTQCPSGRGTVKIYDGFAAGDHYQHRGGGVELLCLPKQPSWGKYSGNRIGNAFLYGTEYEIFREDSRRLFSKEVGNQNVPFVVCQSVGRLVALRIPGKTSCYSGWTEEYRGYLFAGHHGHAKSTDYTCVDSYPELVQGKQGDQDGRLLYPVEASCSGGTLPCPPYYDGREVACVICTK